jgi:hypothetical protein
VSEDQPRHDRSSKPFPQMTRGVGPADDGLDHEGRTYESTTWLRLANGPLTGPVLCRVVSMVLARANCPMDRLDDALLICDAISAHAPDHANDGHLAFAVSARAGGFELRVGELTEGGASSLVQDTVMPGIGNVLERMTDELRIEPTGENENETLVLALAF